MGSELSGVAEAGDVAGRAGQPVTDCPYPPGSVEAALWVRHWVAATAQAGAAAGGV